MKKKVADSPERYFRMSIRHLKKDRQDKAVEAVKKGLKKYPNDRRLTKWLTAIRGRFWVEHMIGRTGFTKEDIEEIAEDIAVEVMEEIGATPDVHEGIENIRQYPLDLHDHGIHIYGVSCTKCDFKGYPSEDSAKEFNQLIESHKKQTGHQGFRMLGVEYHQRRGCGI